MATFVELSTKAKMPIVGLGTWKVSAKSWDISCLSAGLGISSSFYGIYWEFGTLEPEPKLFLTFLQFQASKLCQTFPSSAFPDKCQVSSFPEVSS